LYLIADYGRSHHVLPRVEVQIDRVQMAVKMEISSSTIVRAARAAGSNPHLTSVLQQGWKSTNIH
jgi:hypothetical protein